LKISLGYGFKSYIAAFFSFVVLRVDLLMVKHMLGFEQAGYYSIAANAADIFSICPLIVGTLLFPKMISIADEKQKFEIVKKVAFAIFVGMSALAVFSALFAKTVVITLLGETFIPVVPAFLWLLPGLVLFAANVIFMNYFASIEIPWVMIFSPGIAAFINVFLNLKMITQMGIVGASISSTISYSAMLLMSLIYLIAEKRCIQHCP
jgi:O-antigen/teichoic acid export membrane protein